MKRLILSSAIFAAILVSACSSKSESATTPPAPDTTKKIDNQARGTPDATKNPDGDSQPAKVIGKVYDSKAEAQKLAKKAWAWAEARYNQVPENPQMPFWGPKGQAPISAFILSGALKSGMIGLDDARVKDTVHQMVQSQASDGSWYWGEHGSRAVYCTSAVVNLLSYIRDNGGDKYEGKDAIVRAAEKGMDYLKASQVGAPDSPLKELTKTDMHYGGWAYSKDELGPDKVIVDKKTGEPKPAANLSTTIFALDAAAAFGLDKSDPMWERAQVFLQRLQNAAEADKGILIKTDDGKTVVDPDPKDPNYGGARYSPNTTKTDIISLEDDRVILKSYGSMTYALLRAYMHTGLSKDDIRVKLAYGWLAKNFSVTRNPGFPAGKDLDQQGLYYQYMQMARTLSLYGDEIKNPETGFTTLWKQELLKQLAKTQSSEGSWVNMSDRWSEGSDVLVTGYVLNTLGVLISE